jgi:hypothetical protein
MRIALIREQEALILKDAATAQVCKYDYGYTEPVHGELLL